MNFLVNKITFIGPGHFSVRMVGNPADHRHIVALSHPFPGMLMSSRSRGTRFRWEVLTEKENLRAYPPESLFISRRLK